MGGARLGKEVAGTVGSEAAGRGRKGKMVKSGKEGEEVVKFGRAVDGSCREGLEEGVGGEGGADDGE